MFRPYWLRSDCASLLLFEPRIHRSRGARRQASIVQVRPELVATSTMSVPATFAFTGSTDTSMSPVPSSPAKFWPQQNNPAFRIAHECVGLVAIRFRCSPAPVTVAASSPALLQPNASAAKSGNNRGRAVMLHL